MAKQAFADFGYRARQMIMDVASNRRRVIFMHIPKCAGNSVSFHFRRTLGGMFLHEFRADESWKDRVEKAKTARFVSGHFGWDVLEEIRGDAFVFTILREPFQRLKSAYWYTLEREKIEPEEVGSRSLNGMTFEEFVQCPGADNRITRQLAAAEVLSLSSDIPRERLLDLAIGHLGAFDYIGFTHTLDTDLREICRRAGVVPPAAAPVKNKVDVPKPAEMDGVEALCEQSLALDRIIYDTAQRARS